jgi:hypothetical protein
MSDTKNNQEPEQPTTIKNDQPRWWENRFWQITIALILLLILTIPIPILLDNKGSTIVLTWVSILASIGGTWYFAYESFNRNQEKTQKEKALIAIRRPIEISRATQRIYDNIVCKKEIVSKLEPTELQQNKKYLLEIFEEFKIHVTELSGHLSYAIADWQDILGQDIRVAEETYEKIGDLLQIGKRELDDIRSSYESRLEEAERKGTNEVKKVKDELMQKLKEKEKEIDRKAKEAYEKGKKDSEILRMGTSGNPLIPSSGSAQVYIPGIDNKPIAGSLPPNLLNYLLSKNRCPQCDSNDTSEILGSFSPFFFNHKRKCNVCGFEFEPK